MKCKTLWARTGLVLLAVLFSLTGARAQQALPYEYGFEDRDLSTDGWELQGATSNETTIHNNPAKSGAYGFQFQYGEQNAYLVSPVLDGGNSIIEMSFWHRDYSDRYGDEQFQVGYTTDEKVVDASKFTYGDVVTSSADWQKYSTLLPAGTKRVAVKYVYGDHWYLFIDDFTFEASNGIQNPSDLAASEVGSKSAVLSWTENGTATAWEICLNGDEENVIAADSNPFTLTGLTPTTSYTAMVRAIVNEEHSKWSSEVVFRTEEAYPAPQNLVASNVTATSATISWEGAADSYNLRYRTVAKADDNVIFSDGFEDGISQWTIIRNGEGTPNTDWRVIDATSYEGGSNHSGSSVAMTRSWSTYGYDVDNWLISPLVDLGGTLKYWVRDDNSYHEHYDIYVSTTTKDIFAFTKVYEPGNASSTWTEVTVDLSAYAGYQGYIAFRHTDYDQDFLWIDDVTITAAGKTGEWVSVNNATTPYAAEGLTDNISYQVEVQAVYAEGESTWVGTSFTTLEAIPTPTDLAASNITKNSAVLSWTENGDATSWVVNVYDNTEDDSFGEFTTSDNPYTLTGLNPETEYMVAVRPSGDNNKWSSSIIFTTDIAFPAPTDLAVANITATSAEISWTSNEEATGAELQYAEGTPVVDATWSQYDDGTMTNTIGLGGGSFQWGVMFPAGSYQGNVVNKVLVYDTKAMTGTVTIFNDGDTAPESPIATTPITLTGEGAFIEVNFGNLAINDSKNVWVIVSNESGTDYPTACSNDVLNDPNGRWVEINGSWYDLADAGIPGYAFMLRAEFASATDPSTLKWTTVAEVTSPTELADLTPDTDYVVRVKNIYGTEGESAWSNMIGFATPSTNPVPTEITIDLAADGATLTWEGKGDSYNVQYRTASLPGESLFKEDFENGLDQWIIVTAGDGPDWSITTQNGTKVATAYSWYNNVPYHADNWLISPAVELGGVLKFSVVTAPSYPDSYEVLLSTTGTEIEDFTETLQAMAKATSGDVTIDLSAYAGQTGYIAFHHVSYDCYLLAIDNIAVNAPNLPAGDWQNMAVTEATATLSGLATNNAYEYQIQSIKDSDESDWTDARYFALLTLANDEDNTSIIEQFDGKLAYVTLADRTLYKDGTWNTICLPFTLDNLSGTPLEGADVRTLIGVSAEDYTVTLNFSDAGAIETAWGQYYYGVPYLLKWDNDDNIVNPEFANVIIKSGFSNMSYGSSIGVTFKGTYAPISFAEEDKSILFVGAENKLYWPLAGAKVGAQRAYFEIDGTEAEVAGIKEFILNFGDEEATGIEMVDAQSSMVGGSIYNLAGQKMSKMQKGINIVNGKKVLF